MLIFIENKIQKKIAKIQKKGEQYSRGKCAQFLEDHQTKLNRIENRMVIPLSNDTAIFYFVDFNSATTAIVLRLKLMNFRRAENGAAIPLGRKTGHDGPRAISKKILQFVAEHRPEVVLRATEQARLHNHDNHRNACQMCKFVFPPSGKELHKIVNVLKAEGRRSEKEILYEIQQTLASWGTRLGTIELQAVPLKPSLRPASIVASPNKSQTGTIAKRCGSPSTISRSKSVSIEPSAIRSASPLSSVSSVSLPSSPEMRNRRSVRSPTPGGRKRAQRSSSSESITHDRPSRKVRKRERE